MPEVLDSSRYAVAVFVTAEVAGRAVQALRENGVPLHHIGTATRSQSEMVGMDVIEHHETHAATQGMTAGAALGVGIGALATVLLPGVGVLLVSGILASAAGFGVAGAAVGGLIGALSTSDDSADSKLDEYFAHGTVLVAVRTSGSCDEVSKILAANGGRDLHTELRSPLGNLI